MVRCSVKAPPLDEQCRITELAIIMPMPTTYAEQLRTAANELERAATEYGESDAETIQRVIEAADKIGRAWSGSNLGFHSCIYYINFEAPPPGAHFSSEWGRTGGALGHNRPMG